MSSDLPILAGAGVDLKSPVQGLGDYLLPEAATWGLFSASSAPRALIRRNLRLWMCGAEEDTVICHLFVSRGADFLRGGQDAQEEGQV